MDSHVDDEPQLVHMLALDSDGEVHDEESAMLDLNEELRLMIARESMGSSGVLPPPPDIAPLFIVPPPPPDIDPLFMPGMNDSLMGDSFILGSEEDTELAEPRNENLDVPVIINGDTNTSEPDESVERDTLSPLPPITRTISRQSSPGIIAHKEDNDLLLEGSLTFSSRNSGRSREPSPAVTDRKSSQSVIDHQRTPLTVSSSQDGSTGGLYLETDRPNTDTAPPIIPVLPSSENASVITETPPAYEQKSCESAKVIPMETASSRSSTGLIWGMSRPVFFILAFYLLFVTVAFAYFVAQYLESPSEVEGLEAQVDGLQRQNKRLQSVILDLNSTCQSGEEKCETLSGLVDELQNQTDFLQAQLHNLTVENEGLKETVLECQLANR